MGFFKRFFGGSNPTPAPSGSTDRVQKPEIKETDFIDPTDPNGEQEEPKTVTVTFDWATGHPIDDIYAYIRADWETKGVHDAGENPDINYQNIKVNLILDGLHHVIELTRLKYEEKISRLDTEKVTAESFGLVGSIQQIETTIKICNRHLEKINQIEKGINEPNSVLQTMVESYKRGFGLGVSRHINEIVTKGQKK